MDISKDKEEIMVGSGVPKTSRMERIGDRGEDNVWVVDEFIVT